MTDDAQEIGVPLTATPVTSAADRAALAGLGALQEVVNSMLASALSAAEAVLADVDPEVLDALDRAVLAVDEEL